VAVLSAVLEQPERLILEALEVAWRLRLLEDADGGYRLAHDLIREVLEGDLGPARRAVLHRRMAEVLQGRPGGTAAAVLAYHYGRSDTPEEAVGYLEQAGDQAQDQQGRAAAESFFREAVQRLEGLGRRLDAARVREKLGAVLQTSARYTEALACLEPAAEAQRAAGNLEAVGRVEAVVALVHTDAGTAAEGLARLEPVVALLAGAGPSPALAALYTAQGDLLYMLGRLGEDLAASYEAERIARVVGDEQQLAYALCLRSIAAGMLGRLDEGVQAGKAAIAAATASGYQYILCWSLIIVSILHQEGGSFAAARQGAERALQLAERHGFRTGAAAAMQQRGWLSFLSGAWDDARHDLEEAVALGRAIGPFWASAYAPFALASLCLVQSADAKADSLLEEGERLLHARGEAHARRLAACVLAARDLLVGQPARARARLASLLAPGGLEHDPTAVQVLLAQAQLDLGAVGEAAALISRAVTRARAQGMRALLVEALRVAALVATRQGRGDEAMAAFQDGLTLARHLGYPYGEALLLQASSALAAQTAGPEATGARQAEAQAILHRLGARADLKPVPGLVSCW
jgi:tetratricopeptide (TPR) repeat protein